MKDSLLRLVIFPIIFRNQLPDKTSGQPGEPDHYFVEYLPINPKGMTNFLA